MNIGLIDVDGHNFPNLALMKISAYHKSKGDSVEMAIGLKHYDKVYMSRVFDNQYSSDYTFCVQADEIIKGGTGYDLKNKLPDEIEHQCPDYSLYGIKREAFGFLTRGCPRGCHFCIVGEKEGLKSVQVADLDEFWRGQKTIQLIDSNLFACKDRTRLFNQLIGSKAKLDFQSGLDARITDDEAIWFLKNIKYEMLHFAWDNANDTITPVNLKNMREKVGGDSRKFIVYVLTNYNTTIEQDLYRIYKLREIGLDPYVMIFDKGKFVDLSKNRLRPLRVLLKTYNMEQIDHFKQVWKMQRWVNKREIWRSCNTFEEYLKGR